MTANQKVDPPLPPERVRWLYKHGAEIKAIRVDYEMLTADSAKTVWDIELSDGHKCRIDESRAFADLLNFYPHADVPSHRAIAAMKRDLVEMCRRRDEWEKANAKEIAQYKRLKAKFEGTP